MATDAVRNQLRILKSLGFGFLEGIEVTEAREEAPIEGTVRNDSAPPDFDGAPLGLEERLLRLEEVAREAALCQACRLCHNRTNSVPGEGDPMAELMFIGEGPGATEDQLGRPFVGAAGDMLTKIILAMQFTREEVFIANIVKCRPPGNRQPEADEMEICLPFLERQVAAIRPKVIVLLGKTALMGLFPDHRKSAITTTRGHWLDYRGIPVMPTFHPAYLLRSPQQKKFVWDDMQQVMKVFGKTAPK